MYTVLLVILIGLGGLVGASGLSSGRRWLTVVGGLVLLGTAAFFGLMDFWAEMLWFDAVGYSARFWTVILGSIIAAVIGAVAGGVIVYLLTWPIPSHPPVARWWPELVAAIIGLIWGVNNWETLLRYWYGVTTEVRDPILGRDTGFYLFTLPFYDALYGLLVLSVLISLIAAVAFLVVPRHRDELDLIREQQVPRRRFRDYRAVYVTLGGLALVLAWGKWLSIFHLMYSQWGAVSGPGWTDVTIRLPGYWIVAAALTIAGLVLLVPPSARRLHDWATTGEPGLPLAAVGVPVGAVAVVWFLALSVAPGLMQWLVVEPNEISREKPFILHNIEFTRRGFQLDKVEQREFPVAEEFTEQTAQQHEAVLSQVRLWDPRALVDVYKQFQEIRLYYEFPDVDIDRYTIDGRYRQVMVSPREMRLENLSEQGQTFVNRHFKYTHGYGLTMAPVSEFTPDGLPDLLIKNLPPRSESPSLQVDEPAIYYGLLSDTYAVVNSEEEEFDYPQYVEAQSEKRFREAGEALERLSQALEQLRPPRDDSSQ